MRHFNMFHTCARVFGSSALVAAIFSCSAGFQNEQLSKGQTVYVSVDSHVLTAPRGMRFSLGATLVIRNTDMSNSMRVTTADFFDTEGKLLKRFADTPMDLKPLETKFVHLPEKDVAGGLGANFIVRWSAGREINSPIIECLMIGTQSGQGISFVSSGKVIKEHTR